MSDVPSEASEMTETPSTAQSNGRGATRRGLFAAVGAATVGVAAGWMLGRGVPGSIGDAAGAVEEVSDSPDEDALADHRRPGITSPAVPQRHVRIEVLTVPGGSTVVLDRVRAAIAGVTAQPVDAGEVTVTAGFAPVHAQALWPERAASATDLPGFSSDSVDLVSGGDVAVQVCAETASAVADVAAAVRAAIGDASLVWAQTGTRDAPTSDGTARTTTGFIDGIINPRSAQELEAGVWSGGGRRDTHWVIRRMRISSDFGRRPTGEQERAVGRRRDTGAPLSGGVSADEIDLFAKRADGTPLIAVDAHARRAHPSHIGRALMLRRSYSADLGGDAGLLFIAFMSDPSTFVLTQRRLDEMDALLAHTRTDASGIFFVPDDLVPGDL